VWLEPVASSSFAPFVDLHSLVYTQALQCRLAVAISFAEVNQELEMGFVFEKGLARSLRSRWFAKCNAINSRVCSSLSCPAQGPIFGELASGWGSWRAENLESVSFPYWDESRHVRVTFGGWRCDATEGWLTNFS
jgi:hypothetical protein